MTTTEIMAILGGLLLGYRLVGKFIGRTRDKPEESGDSYSTDQHGFHHNANQAPNPSVDESNINGQTIRVFSCPTCNQKIRVRVPPPDGIGKCSKCETRFFIHLDDDGNLYITKTTNNDQENEESSISTVAECFAVLELPSSATSIEIKAAYRKRMMEYHPDKVASLGGKLRVIADRETKKLNMAYAMLKDTGYL